jgi:hypothetical protein
MAFCTSCGANVDATAAACPKCGAALAGAAAAPAAGAAPAKKGGSALKIILIVLGVFFLLGALVVGGIIYGAYRVADSVKQEVTSEGGTRVETPFGTAETNQDPKEIAKELDVEIYPGATPVREGSSSVTFGGVKATTAVFETSDPSKKVYEFYKEEIRNPTMTSSEGDKHTIMAGNQDNFLTIMIEEQDDKTRITISRTGK